MPDGSQMEKSETAYQHTLRDIWSGGGRVILNRAVHTWAHAAVLSKAARRRRVAAPSRSTSSTSGTMRTTLDLVAHRQHSANYHSLSPLIWRIFECSAFVTSSYIRSARFLLRNMGLRSELRNFLLNTHSTWGKATLSVPIRLAKVAGVVWSCLSVPGATSGRQAQTGTTRHAESDNCKSSLSETLKADSWSQVHSSTGAPACESDPATRKIRDKLGSSNDYA